MKDFLKKNLPKPVLEMALWQYSNFARLKDFISDFRRYSKFAMRAEESSFGLSKRQLEAQITRDYHRIEKGLALKVPKKPFGASILRRLDALIPVAEKEDGGSDYLRHAISARDALVKWNEGQGVDDLIAPKGSLSKIDIDIVKEMFYSRHSVRDYSDELVDQDILNDAIAMAALSPSVCNRQPWRMRIYHGNHASDILRYQNGNQGFGSNVPCVALISVELSDFAGAHERNQAWIEGGIFSTSLMWALHGYGLSTCMLNLSQRTDGTARLRNASKMPESEVPIMMIAIGYPREGYRVARSPRRKVENIIAEVIS